VAAHVRPPAGRRHQLHRESRHRPDRGPRPGRRQTGAGGNDGPTASLDPEALVGTGPRAPRFRGFASPGRRACKASGRRLTIRRADRRRKPPTGVLKPGGLAYSWWSYPVGPPSRRSCHVGDLTRHRRRPLGPASSLHSVRMLPPTLPHPGQARSPCAARNVASPRSAPARVRRAWRSRRLPSSR
jgi:hypothetical protein